MTLERVTDAVAKTQRQTLDLTGVAPLAQRAINADVATRQD
jgi:hypothetical protein